MQLLAKLLSARRRARLWAQPEYVGRVAATVDAARAVLKHPSLHANPVASGKMARRLLGDTELLLIMAAAQQEFAQLLTVPQQLQPGKPSHQLLLLLLAHKLLLWWVEAHRL